MSDVTQILNDLDASDPQAAEKLLPLVYEELRKLAASKMAHESPDHTLQATALVHEAYIRLVGPKNRENWDNRGHFFAAAAESIKRILIEHARKKGNRKRGGEIRKLDIDAIDLPMQATPDQFLELSEAIDRLASVDPSAAELVKLRYFGGLDIKTSAKVLGLSSATAYRHWSYARSWLHSEFLSQ